MRQVIGWRGAASDDYGEWYVFYDGCRVSTSRPDVHRDGFYVYPGGVPIFFNAQALYGFEHSF
jgi:hypothetical protein